MDENTNKATYTLMQKVVDKLDVIIENNTKLSEISFKKDIEIKELFSETIKNKTILKQSNLDSENRIINAIIENKTTPSINNRTEYSLLGSKSHYKPKKLVAILFLLVGIWSSIKYLPSYHTEKSLLTKEKEEYEIFYNYVYFIGLKKDNSSYADNILNNIRKKDSLFMNEYKILSNNYEREIRRQELQEELNSLYNNDR